ncbi:MAG TPA: ATP-binding protein [Kofleriaceae bacterium]|nr:ATP-binding protein [Kofleriaceae bacterium]
MSERVDLREFVGAFVVEAEELVAAANASLLDIEAGSAAGTAKPKAVRDLFRALHTIKGLASMIGVEPIVEIAHALETLLRTADRAGGQLGRAAIDVSLQGVLAIAERVRAVAENRAPASVPERLIEAIAATEANADTVTVTPSAGSVWDARLSASERQQLAPALRGTTSAWTLAFLPSDHNASRGVTIATVRARLAELGEIVKVVPRTLRDAAGAQTGLAFDILVVSTAPIEALAEAAATTPAEVVALAPPPAEPAGAGPAVELAGPGLEVTEDAAPIGRAVVRVELSRLDELQDQLSLLIVSRFRIERELAAHAALGHDVRRLREVVELQARQLRDLRRALLKARMVRVAEVFEPLTLLVRSVARSSHKDVRLELDTRDTELDKAVADRLLPAMVHLVRNAVDHAIEPPSDRAAAGKPTTGTIRVSCTQIAGNQLELTIEDDGRGIDRAEIARRARRSIESDDALLDVLATPGFSTRDTVTRTSGRGIGMDIVRRIAVRDLGGDLALTTRPGLGTRFTMRVPLTIAIIDVFSFECGNQTFVVPVAAIDEIFELTDAGVTPPRATPAGRAAGPAVAGPIVSLLERRGAAMPLLSLGAVLAIDDGTRARKALVTRRNGEPVAFAVDRMLGRYEVVVRSIDDPLVDVPGIAGATDLGDGRPTLVLDLGELAMLSRAGAAS